MVLAAQRTIFGLDLDMAVRFRDNYLPKSNTTLNEKFNLNTTADLPVGFPKVKYYAIGVGGSDIITGVNGYTYSQHNPSDAALFQHIPFVMRLTTNDLDDREKLKYRFRIIKNFNNTNYVCYYLKMIPNIDYRDPFYKIESNAGNNTLSIFSTDTDTLLNPIPVDRNITLQDTETSTYLTKLAKIEFSLDSDDLNELSSVYQILGLSTKTLTEIGVCMGWDSTINNVTEAVGVQIAYHITVNIDIATTMSSGMGILRAIEIGGSEPMILR
jgi:hypothetical protein